jgi:hypothetical protein
MSGIRLALAVALLCLGCRAGEGEPCAKNDDCALGLYCPEAEAVCTDRGNLLRQKASEQYVYPIPVAAPKAAPKVAPMRAPVPLVVP